MDLTLHPRKKRLERGPIVTAEEEDLFGSISSTEEEAGDGSFARKMSLTMDLAL